MRRGNSFLSIGSPLRQWRLLAAIGMSILLGTSCAREPSAPVDAGCDLSCGAGCVDPRTDPGNCGGCGRRCPGPCIDGACRTVVQVSAGWDRTCGILSDGAVFCWGMDAGAQIGDYRPRSSAVPVRVALPGRATAVSTAYTHSCAVLEDTTVRCWGYHRHGRLGDGTDSETFDNVPAKVVGLDGVAAVSAGSYAFTCARRLDGTAYCWGSNEDGQLGDGTTQDRHTPVRVRGLATVAGISAGRSAACAWLEDGTAWCWGQGGGGALGDGRKMDSSTPVQVRGLTGVVGIAAGLGAACAWLEDASAWCWGDLCPNDPWDMGPCAAPAPLVGWPRIASMSEGIVQACARLEDGRVLCFGSNGEGQLGDGTWEHSYRPVVVKDLSDVAGLVSGMGHGCAWTREGLAYCWGRNSSGQLGDATYENRNVPVRVSSFP